MTIDEAMADLSVQLEVKHRLGKDQQADAIRLGIEALKCIKWQRIPPACLGRSRLPGETLD